MINQEALDNSEQDVYVFPASFAQRRMWFLDQFQPGSPIYNIPLAVRIKGALRVDALERGIQEIVRRHESLRATFAMMDSEPVQVIHKAGQAARITLNSVNLRQLSEQEREVETLRLAMAEAQRPFNLADGPLLRATLIKLGKEEHALLLTMHHIVSDAWSQGVFLRELAVLYDAFSRGKPSPLPDLTLQYADFTEWQRAWLQGEVMEEQLDYWRERLGDNPAPLSLPTDHPRPAVKTSRGAKLSRSFPKPLGKALQELGRSEGATLFMTLLAAFQVLLHRYTGQDDICVGTPVANRNRAEIEGLIGCFINTLVMRTDLSGDPSFRELLRRARDVAMGAYANQDIPFEKLVEELNPERDMSRTSLFQVMLILQNTPREVEIAGRGLTLSALKVDKQTSNFDLSVAMVEESNGLGATAEYSADLFEAATIERLLGHFQTLLECVVVDPDQRISALPLMTKTEEWRLLSEWNNNRADYSTEGCVHQIFEEQVERAPDAIAVVDEDGQLTYDELNRRANQLAHYLQRLGATPGTPVGICVDRSSLMAVGLLGILKSGAAFAPLDPAYPEGRKTFILKDAQAPILLTQERLESDRETIARESQQNPVCESTADNLAYVIYTSGSTGAPKGTPITHRNLNPLLRWSWEYFNLGERTSVLQNLNYCFDFGVFELLTTLLFGGTLHFVDRDKLGDFSEYACYINSHRINTIHSTPSFVRNLLPFCDRLESLETIHLGGEPLTGDLIDKVFDKVGDNCVIYNGYGPTEATINCSIFKVGDKLTWKKRAPSNIPIGKASANNFLYILDSNRAPAPIGASGELHVGGVGLTYGYLNRAELTAASFIPNPFSNEPGARLYRTGDLVRYRPDGDIEYLGRGDHQVKVRGFRIELGEIEAALNQHPAVREAVVLAREDGPGNRRLVAYLVCVNGTTPSISELHDFLQRKLPAYMAPAAYIWLEALPLTPNGKIDRRALPSPDPAGRESDEDYVAPRTPIEEILAGIWARVLGVNRVSIYDNFFAIGGHSLLATRVNSRLRDAFHVRMPVRNIFEFPTIASLAVKIEQAMETNAMATSEGWEAPVIRPARRDQDLPLSFAQERLWFLDQLTPGSSAYNIAEAYRITGPLNLEAMERSLNEIARRHEVLRTTFATADAVPVQVIAPELKLSLTVVDLGHLPEAKRDAEVRRLAAEEARRPFDLTLGPLLRATALRLADEEHVALLTIHHIISDDWSTRVYLREMAILYDAFVAQKPSPLPDLPIQYADYASWQREWLRGEALEAQLSYWKRRLAGAPPILELPTDRPRPAVQSFRGASQSFVLTEKLSADLAGLSRQEGVTLFMTMLAAFQTLLYRYTGQDDICIGSPVSNRSRSELEGLIGFFVNILALRADLSGDPSFCELLLRVREMALEAYGRQDLPFEKLAHELQPERDLSRTPLFQVMLVMQNIPGQPPELARRGLSLSSMKSPGGVAKFDLTLFITEAGGRLSGALNYNTDLFDGATIARMLDHFRNLLEAIVADPNRRIASLPMLSEAEERQLLVEWSGSDGAPPLDRCLHQMFEEQVERTPDAIALTLEDSSLSYRELNQRANQVAHYLRNSGVGPETLVGVCMDRSIEMMLGLLGILKAGGAYMPLDPNNPPDRLAFMIEDARVREVLTQKHLVELLQAHQVRLCCLDADWPEITEGPFRSLMSDKLQFVEVLGAGPSRGQRQTEVCRTFSEESEKNPENLSAAENLAYVIYTSGSTGRPKGSLITHRGLTNYLNWCLSAYPVAAGRGSVVHSTIAFDATITALFVPLLAGGGVRLLPERITLDALADTLRREADFSLIKLTPAHLDLLRNQLSPEEAKGLTRAFVIGGENLLNEQIQFWREHASGTHLFNEYGPTEAVVGCVVYDAATDRPEDGASTCLPAKTPAKLQSGSVPIGRPIPNTRVYALDRDLQPVPAGARGELCLGGVGLARGYLDRPDLTAEKFIPHPFSGESGERLYRTGDLVRFLPDGALEFLGRVDEQVKIRGYRIECGEIESVLCQREDVREAVVMAREDAPGDRRLVAYYVPRSARTVGAMIAHSELRNLLKERLPEYMIPSFFVELEVLPLTLNGKVDRRALPAPDKTRPELEAVFVAARTPAEERLAAICAEVLGLERVGVHDNFFSLGGHSLLATQVVSRVRQAFEIELPLRSLFETPTVAGLAETIETILWAAKGPKSPSGAAADDREEGEI